MARLVFLVCMVMSALVSPPAQLQAWAHAQLLSTDPPSGAVLAAPPSVIRFSFNEPVSPVLVRWLGPDDQPLAAGSPVSRDGTLEIPAPANPPQGTHLITVRVMSLDGHAVPVSLAFSIGTPSARPAADGAPGLPLTALVAGAARAVVVLVIALVVGGAVFRAFIDPAQPMVAAATRWRLTALGVTALVAGAAFIGQGADLMGTTLREALFAPAVWQAALGSSFALSLGLGAGAVGVAIGSLSVGGSWAGTLAVLALVLGAASMAVTGHAASARPPLTLATVALHGAALIIWIGALAPLMRAAAHGGGAAVRVLERFSPVGIVCVGVLGVSGGLQAAIQVETPAALVTTAYGGVLVVKLALATGMIVLAARHKLWLTPALARGEVGAGRRLARSIRLELGLAVLLVLVTAGFRATPPPRAELAADRQGVSLHLHQLEAMIDLTLTPGRSGTNAASLVVMSGEFGPLDAKGLRLTFARPDLDLVLPPVEARRGADGLWHVPAVDLPRGGPWQVTARVLVTDFKAVDLTGTLELRR